MTMKTLILFLCILSTKVYAEKNSSHESWSVECNNNKCYASQILLVKKQNNVSIIGGLNLILLNENKAMLTVRVSGNANEHSGIGFKVDKYKSIQVEFTQCTEKKCESNVIIDEQLLNELLSSKVLMVAFENKITAKQVTLPFSLKGFTQAYHNLKTHMNNK